MSDQAFRLRSLMHAGVKAARRVSEGSPWIIAVAGGKGGVGTTTVAVNLAMALAQEGRRTLLVDADAQRADIAVLCGLADGPCVHDVLEGRRSLHEAIRLGPGGIQVVPGRWGGLATNEWPPRSQDSFIAELRGMSPYADVVMLDVGTASGPTARRFWQAADEVLLVTSPDGVAVMDGYAAVKMLVDVAAAKRVSLVVNQVIDLAVADAARDRLLRACRRFLRLELRTLGSISFDQALREAGQAMRPTALRGLSSGAGQEIVRLAERLSPLGNDKRAAVTAASTTAGAAV